MVSTLKSSSSAAPRRRSHDPGRHRLCCRRRAGSVAATLTGLPSRAIWFSSDRISYWIQAPPQFKTLQDIKGKKDCPLRRRRRHQPRGVVDRLGESGFNPKDYTMVAIPGQQIQILYSLESGFVEAALMSPPHIFAAAKKGFNKLWMWRHGRNAGGGLTAMVKTVQERPAEVVGLSARCKSPKMRCANPNPRPSS